MNLITKFVTFFCAVIFGNILLVLLLSSFNLVSSWAIILLFIEMGIVLYVITYKYVLNPVYSLYKALKDIDFSADIINFNTVDNLNETGCTETKYTIQRFKYLLDIITERINRYNNATFRGEHDELTGCYNKLRLQKYKTSYEVCSQYAVIFIDVNNLKKMNDTFGHGAGDALLRHASNRLNFWTNYGDVYRMGGDEFMIVVTDKSQEAIFSLINKWYPTVGQLNRDSDGFKCLLSYGVAFGTNGDNFDTILKEADDKMYEMKVRIKKELGEEMR